MNEEGDNYTGVLAKQQQDSGKMCKAATRQCKNVQSSNKTALKFQDI